MSDSVVRDPHSGPVPETAWGADALARQRGRVEMFNATRAGGLDNWTMDDVAAAQERYADHVLFPKGRLTNYVRYAKVDLEARCEIERIPGSSPQRICRWRTAP